MTEFRVRHTERLRFRLTTAPPKARCTYLRRIRCLIREMQPGREYPFDYIRYRIIGYCINLDTGENFPAEDLKADLERLEAEVARLCPSMALENAPPAAGPSPADAEELEPAPAYHYEKAFDLPGEEQTILHGAGEACRKPQGQLLSPMEEVDLFRGYNYCKYQVTALTRSAADCVDRSAAVERINFYKGIALQCRNRIIEANIRLVYRTARLHLGKNIPYDDLISDGCHSLMRAVENYNYRRGTRFSTYATWVMTKNFARTIPQENAFRKAFRTEAEEIIENVPASDGAVRARFLPRLWQAIEEAIDELPEKERIAVTRFFGVSGDPMSLREIAPELGLKSKEIARRYKDRGLQRLQALLAAELSDDLST
jgi:RNA polymerase sigma factor (sigma-70 family)